jgi:hypothetical protein
MGGPPLFSGPGGAGKEARSEHDEIRLNQSNFMNAIGSDSSERDECE